MLEAPYLVFVSDGSAWRVYLHVRSGSGRSARRRLLGVWSVEGPLTRRSLPNVLRHLADAMESRVPLSAGQVPEGSGALGGGGGETHT